MILLAALFTVKHFVADYPLQTPYMLQKFKSRGWVLPLSAHCGVHAAFSFAIAFSLGSFGLALKCAALDFTVHFIMDRVKASPFMLGRYKVLSANEFPIAMAELESGDKLVRWRAKRRIHSNKYFWWALGFDQMIHALTDLAIVALILG